MQNDFLILIYHLQVDFFNKKVMSAFLIFYFQSPRLSWGLQSSVDIFCDKSYLVRISILCLISYLRNDKSAVFARWKIHYVILLKKCKKQKVAKICFDVKKVVAILKTPLVGFHKIWSLVSGPKLQFSIKCTL